MKKVWLINLKAYYILYKYNYNKKYYNGYQKKLKKWEIVSNKK